MTTGKILITMKTLNLIFVLLLMPISLFSQTFEGLKKSETQPNVYYSTNAEESAKRIGKSVAGAEAYFSEKFKTKPFYNLLILNPEDWKTFAHPNAIYGIPHFLPDGRLVVAAENNDFWRRNTPPVSKIPKELANQLVATYQDKNGEISLQKGFDLLAIHELGHAFQKSVGLKSQRNWMNELMCNVLLHTYIAEKEPENLAALTVLPKVSVQSMDARKLPFTSLADFESKYDEIAQNHPDNYGWYQYRFHVAAAKIYDNGGEKAMLNIWNAFLNQKEKLDDPSFQKFLNTSDKNLAEVVTNWNEIQK